MIWYVLAMGKQHQEPHVVVGYGIKIFWPDLFITSPDHLVNPHFCRGSPAVGRFVIQVGRGKKRLRLLYKIGGLQLALRKVNTGVLSCFSTYILVMQRFRVVYRRISRESVVFSGIHTSPVTRWEGWVWCSWIALIDWKIRWNIEEYTVAFLHSEWLYFLWHGIITG